MQILNYARRSLSGEPVLPYTFATIVTYRACLQSLFLRPLAVICGATWPAVIYAATIPESEKRRRVTDDHSRISFGLLFFFYLPPVGAREIVPQNCSRSQDERGITLSR